MSGLDSLLLLSEFPKYSCPPCASLSLSVSLSLTPPFSITWSDLLFAVALLSPCPRHLSLCHPWLANTVPHLYNSSPLQHTSPHRVLSRLTHIHTHTPLDDVSSQVILPLFALKNVSVKQPITGPHNPGPQTRFYLIGFHQAAHTYQNPICSI